MRRDDDPALAALLEARDRVVLRGDLVGSGLDGGLLDRRVRSGAWTSFGPSVAVASRSPSLRQRCRAALEHAGTPSAVTGRAACLLHGLRDAPDAPQVEVLLAHDRRVVSTPQVRVVRTRRPPALVAVGDLRVVAVARAVRDASRSLPALREVRALLLAAVADERVLVSDLEAEVARGAGRAAFVRALRDARSGAASAPEAEFHDLVGPWVRAQGLEVLLNPWLLLAGTVLCRPDLYVPALGRGFEVDSVAHHGSGRQLSRTLQRHERAEQQGVRLRHVTPFDVRQRPAEVMASVREHLQAPRVSLGQLEVRAHDDPPPWWRQRRVG